MKTLFEAIQIEKPKVMQQQIREAVRALLVSGKVAPGDRLPSTRELAAIWGADVHTIHLALSVLEKEGLLVRRQGKGTFVQKRAARLTCVAIYYAEDIWAEQATEFQQAVHAALKRELNQRGIRTRVWIDHRPKVDHAAPEAELCQAAAQREFQALIVTSGGGSLLDWGPKLPVAFTCLSSARLPNGVRTDTRQLVELSLRALAKQGCRSVGLITPTSPGAADYNDFFKSFTEVSGQLGLALRNSWMRLAPRGVHIAGRPQESFGYEQFLELWRQRERPDGLVAMPDTTARGVVLGLREKQVRVPTELKLVLHKNEAIDLLCPMPATFVVSSERAIARALIEQVQKQFRGERCEPMTVGYMVANSTPEPTTTRKGKEEATHEAK